MTCAADLSLMTDAEAHEACEELRKFLVIRRLDNAFDELFNATPAADTNPCVDAVGGGTFEQGDAA